MDARKPGRISRQELGKLGEEMAAEHLTRCGYRILHRNWRCRTGEIDIVAECGESLVFVEVRSRRMTGRYGEPQESVDWRKQKRIRDTALRYAGRMRQTDVSLRFDVISVWFRPNGEFHRLDHLEHAF